MVEGDFGTKSPISRALFFAALSLYCLVFRVCETCPYYFPQLMSCHALLLRTFVRV